MLKLIKILLNYLCLSLILQTIPSFASIPNRVQSSPLKQKQQALSEMTNKISALKHTLSNAEDKKETLLDELKNVELQINQYEVEIAKIKKYIRQKKRRLKLLEKKQKKQLIILEKNQTLLADLVSNAYLMGKHDYLKLLLNQEDVNRISRTWTYYGYIRRYRSKILKKIQDNVNVIEAQKQQIAEQNKQLQTLMTTQQQQQQKLTFSSQYQKQVVSRLNREINTHHKQLSQLQQNKRTLTHLIQTLALNRKQYQHKTIPFYRLKRHLAWPVRGLIAHHFGAPIKNTPMTYRGVFIKAPEGKTVRAIHAGKIVFSNWLRGFGLMIIIDHGYGYLSLYAHNHSLYKKVGDKVTPGELIATVGHSGGNQNNGLYFEIRYKENPLNPEIWCIWT